MLTSYVISNQIIYTIELFAFSPLESELNQVTKKYLDALIWEFIHVVHPSGREKNATKPRREATTSKRRFVAYRRGCCNCKTLQPT